MKRLLLSIGLLSLVISEPSRLQAEEAHASVYIVDPSAEFAVTGGACLPYHSTEVIGKDREVLAIAKAPPGATLLLIAFDRDAPYLDLAPVLAVQTDDSKPLRFPAIGSAWPFDKTSNPIDLYVAVFPKDDPSLSRITEYVEWLGEALVADDRETAMLHSHAIKNRLTTLLRKQNVGEYRAKFGNSLTDSIRFSPASKAAVTRGAKETANNETKRTPKNPVAAVRRGLKTLDEEWREDSQVIPFGLAEPGVFVFPITTPPVP